MKVLYITYGIFGTDLESYVTDFQSKFDISLTKINSETEPYLLYEMIEKTHFFIKCFEITIANSKGYHFSENEILYPNYLIRINLIYDEKHQDKSIQIQQVMKNIHFIKQLNIFEENIDDYFD